ncbi:hypothetical protein ACS0TY_017334 [Phlomoides rotata]
MAVSSYDREDAVYDAKLAERVELYDELVEAMKHVAKMGTELTAEERDLLSAGYWSVIRSRRISWGALSRLEQRKETEGNKEDVRQINEYKQKLKAEITNICTELISIINEHLILSISNPVATAFYNKMKGDYNRYLAEVESGEKLVDVSNEALEAYEAARAAAELALLPADPLRLSVELNLSFYYNSIKDLPQRACDIAKKAIDEATPQLDNLSGKAYKRSTHILFTLEENIRQWNSDSLSWGHAAEDFTDFSFLT